MRERSVPGFLLRLLPTFGISLLWLPVFAQAPRQPRRIADFKTSAYDCHRITQGATDPVSSRLAQVFDCYSGGLIAIAEEIPADKYTQHILGETIGQNVGHAANTSEVACSHMSGVAAPRHGRTDDKEGMIEYLKSSIEFCKQVFPKLTDAKLGDSIPWGGFDRDDRAEGKTVTRFAAALWVIDVLIERYGAFAGYMQVHGSLADFNTVPLVTGIRNPVLGR